MKKHDGVRWGWSLFAVVAGCSAGATNGAFEGASSSDGVLGRAQAAVSGCIAPVANMVVRTNTTLCPGTYNIGDSTGNGVIQIAANNVMLTISGVTLVGTGTGYGITAIGVNGATIQSSPTNRGHIQNFSSAILINGGAGHSVAENVLSFNAKRVITNTGADFLNIDFEFDQRLATGQIGDGVVLLNVTSATITNNQMDFQQNGISLFNSNSVTVRGNDCSNNQGWGISLLRSSNNTIIDNHADNVNLAASTYCHQVQADACDTAGILVVKGSNDNTVQRNSAKAGGDGIFSAAVLNNVHFGADHDRYIGNDVSQAKHHGIEATFADSLDIENNTILNVGRAGIWIGGSFNSIIRGNTVVGSGWGGIQNQGAHGITVENNVLSNSGFSGIELSNIPFGPLASASANYLIARNTIQNNAQYGIHAQDTLSMNVTGDVMSGNGQGSVFIDLNNVGSLPGPIHINESQLLDANKTCGGVNVSCNCPTFDGNQGACSSAPGCTFFTCSNKCEPVGTTACDAGCSGGCSGSCRDHDGNFQACDAAGCAYYFCANSCLARGTPIEQACPCTPHNFDQAGCVATPGCAFFNCSGQCFAQGTPNCLAGCSSFCGTGNLDCPIESVTDITSDWWGTTNLSTINASICRAHLNPVPIKTSP